MICSHFNKYGSFQLYKRHRFPSSLLQSVVFLYHRYALSLREVEELMLIRGSEEW
jgi:transposase-like protein